MLSRRRTPFNAAALLAVLSVLVFTQSRDAARAAAPKLSLRQRSSRISPQLLRLAAPGAQRAPGIGGLQDATPQLLMLDRAGRVGVQVTARDPKALAPSLKGLGMQGIAADRGRHLLEGFLPIRSLTRLEALGSIFREGRRRHIGD